MAKPGIPTAKSIHPDLEGLDTIVERIQAYPPGTLFRPEDITQGDRNLASAFALSRNSEHFHVVDGWHAGYWDAPSIRMSPKLEDLICSYSQLRDARVVEAGEWSSLRLGMRKYSPLAGHRFYSSGPTEVIMHNTIPLRIVNAPDWLLDDSEEGRLLRALFDTDPKDFEDDLRRWLRSPAGSIEQLEALPAHLETLDLPAFDPEQEDAGPFDRDLRGLVQGAIDLARRLKTASEKKMTV